MDIKLVRDKDNNAITLPIYKFTYKGKIYIVASTSCVNFSQLYVGQDIQLYINEDDPEDFFLEKI